MRIPPNWYAYTPYLNSFGSFHSKLEYHVCLTCLHPNRKNNTTRPHLNQHFAFALEEPVIVKRRRGRPGGSTNRINNTTQRELSAFERNTGCTTRARAGRSRGRAVEAIYRYRVRSIKLSFPPPASH